jgi:hypothetical protein
MLKILKQSVDRGIQITDYEGGWRVREECREEQGRLVVTKLTIEPTTDLPAGGINSRFLRGIQVGKMFELLRQTATKYPTGMQSVLAMFGPRKRRPRWARNDDRFYAELASQYVKVLTTPEGRDKPTEVLAKLRGVRLPLLRSQIHLARKNGFLSEGRQGKAGGELTEKAEQVLGQKKTPPAVAGRRKR